MYLAQLCEYVDDSVNYYIEIARFAANVAMMNIFSEYPDQELLTKLVEKGEKMLAAQLNSGVLNVDMASAHI